jgi:hypothetical protein
MLNIHKDNNGLIMLTFIKYRKKFVKNGKIILRNGGLSLSGIHENLIFNNTSGG